MFTTSNNEAGEQMALYSQLFPSNYAHQITQQQGGETAASEQAKPRRRRRKGKGGETSGAEAAEAAAAAARKRKLTEEQVMRLEVNFGNEHKLESERKDRLAAELGLDPRQVAVWFQNRRARWKNKKLEEEYSSLKKQHDTVVVAKCCLESEVLRLKEQLNEAEREIQRLAERAEGGSSHSPSSSLSMEGGTMEPPFLAEFGAVQDSGYGEFYAPVDNYIQGMEWMNLYL